MPSAFFCPLFVPCALRAPAPVNLGVRPLLKRIGIKVTMCYMTVLSTSCETDLTTNNNEFVKFSKSLPGVPEEKYLAHAFKWFIGSKSGCSCELRHLCVSSVELGFGEPEDWFPEEPSEIDATKQIAAIIRALVSSGAEVDCVDAWAHEQKEAAALAGNITVNLSEVSDTNFRFFELHRFNFVK
jgi:hypothetical protein